MAAAPALAQDFPTRPIRLLTATAAASGSDVVARILGGKLSDILGKQIVVDNRSGASGLLAAEILAKAAPDGYTLGITTLTQLMATLLHRRFPMDKDFAPVSRVGATPFLIAASPQLPVKSIPELIAYAKGRPGQVLYASGGPGSIGHLCIELLKGMTGVDLMHVPYKSSILAVTELGSGQVHVLCSAVPTLHATLQNARARALAVSSRQPSKLAPGLPTVTSSVPGFEMDGWFGVIAPAATPRAIISRLNAAIAQVLNQPEVQERLFAVGVEALTSTPAEYGAFLQSEIERWTRVIRGAGIKP